MSYVFMFPGQGSQKVGMGKDFYDSYEVVKNRIDEANEVLQRDLRAIIFEGPEDAIKATQNTQPALYTVESAICDLLREKGATPSLSLGHSLGEYSALYAAGVFSFVDGLRLVAKRGELMAKAGEVTKGTMAAVIGLSREQISEVLAIVTEGVVVPANENSPEQTVISGDVPAVQAACEKLKEAGAKRAILLPVSGAFHSPLMEQAANEFKTFLSEITFNKAQCPVITNVAAQPEEDGETLKELLVKQLLSPVRWVDAMTQVDASGHDTAVEVGPGSVLKGLAKKCQLAMNVVSCGTVDNLYFLAE